MDNAPDEHGTEQPVSLPEILYHYTNSVGLKGILDSRAVWATDIEFLNDSREFVHGREIASQLISSLIREREARDDRRRFSRKLYEHMESEIDRNLGLLQVGLRANVACFSANGDSLSLWRGYGSGGFALGFDGKGLLEALASGDRVGPLAPVTYKREQQPELIRAVAGETVDTMNALWDELYEEGYARGKTKAPDPPDEYFRKIGFKGFRSTVPLYKQVLLMKDASFQVEEEWRTCGFLRTEESIKQLRFRSTSFGLVPYVNVSLADPNGIIPHLRKIVIGPASNSGLRETGIALMVEALGYPRNSIHIEHSQVPFREI